MLIVGSLIVNFAAGASAGAWSDSGLGEAFRGALASPETLLALAATRAEE